MNPADAGSTLVGMECSRAADRAVRARRRLESAKKR
jgi:hypothetical protein